MTQTSIKNFIEEAKKYMVNNSSTVNRDKIAPFQDIYTFLENGLYEEEITFVMGNINLLKRQIAEKANEELIECDDDFVSRFIVQSYFHLGIIYLLMVRTNKKETLKINEELLYLITNVMRKVPYSKYDESIKKILYSELIDIIMREKTNTKTSIVLNTLTDRIIASDTNFSEIELKEYMSSFMLYEVYSRLGIPNYSINEEKHI